MNWLTGPLLAVENLTMRFGGLVAVNAFSFSVGRGDITALIGPNGAGKTTVFNCVTGFYKPTEGRLALARDGIATLDDIAAVTRTSGRHATTANGELFLLERMPDHEIARKARAQACPAKIKSCNCWGRRRSFSSKPTRWPAAAGAFSAPIWTAKI